MPDSSGTTHICTKCTRSLADPVLLRMQDARARRHPLRQAGVDDAGVAHRVAVLQRPLQHPRDDLHVAVRVGVEPGSRRDDVVVVDEQQPVVGVRRVVIAAERERVLGVEPCRRARAAVGGAADVDGCRHASQGSEGYSEAGRPNFSNSPSPAWNATTCAMPPGAPRARATGTPRARPGLAVEHVQRRGGLAVGGRGDEAHVAGAFGGAVVLRQRDDVRRALIPAVERRHLPDRVLGEQLHQLVDVVVLERRDVASRADPWPRAIPARRRSSSWLGRRRRAAPAPAAAGCSPRPWTRRWPRRPRRPSTAAPRAGPAPRAAAATGAAAPPRTPAAPTRGTRRSPTGRTGPRSASPGSGSSHGDLAVLDDVAGRVRTRLHPARTATADAACPPARSGRCWWRCGTTRSAPRICPGTP